MIYYNYEKSVEDVICFQIFICLFNGLLLIYYGLKPTTLPLLFVIFATLAALVVMPLLREIRQFMMIPIIYPLGLSGVKTKVEAICKAIKR